MAIYVNLIRFCRKVRSQKELGIILVAALVLVSILGNAACFYLCQGRQAGDSIGDCLWYSIISITTIGYGDFYATTLGARLGTVFFIVLLGLSGFTIFLGMIIDWVTDMALKGQIGMAKAIAYDHVLIVNFPSACRVRRLIEELQADPARSGREIVVISDSIERLPFDIHNVLFVNGSTLAVETYKQAGIDKSQLAIVLATSYSDSKSDAVVASTVSVIESINPDVHTVAECLDDNHKGLFNSVNCDSIVQGAKITDNLLVQEVSDPGIAQMIDVVTSNTKGMTLFSTEVPQAYPGMEYNKIAKSLLDKDINILCVNRGIETYTSFRGLSPAEGDRIIYIAATRYNWNSLFEAMS